MMNIAIIGAVYIFVVYFITTWLSGRLLDEEGNAKKAAIAATVWAIIIGGLLAITTSSTSPSTMAGLAITTEIIYLFGYVIIVKYTYKTDWKRATLIWLSSFGGAMIITMILGAVFTMAIVQMMYSASMASANTLAGLHSTTSNIANTANGYQQAIRNPI